jgi:hypothetical protein
MLHSLPTIPRVPLLVRIPFCYVLRHRPRVTAFLRTKSRKTLEEPHARTSRKL